MKFLKNPTRNLFFTGKGGVGKTSVACSAAVQLADTGKRVLLVSTDPASNLDEVLCIERGQHPKPSRCFATRSKNELVPSRQRSED